MNEGLNILLKLAIKPIEDFVVNYNIREIQFTKNRGNISMQLDSHHYQIERDAKTQVMKSFKEFLLVLRKTKFLLVHYQLV